MLALMPKPADADAALPAYEPPVAFPVHALHSHALPRPSRDCLSPPTAHVSTASGGSCLPYLFVLPVPPACIGIMHLCFGSTGSTLWYG
jgi:hypothetical protein